MSGERAAAKRAFLDAAGWGEAKLSVLAGDASNRRYDRVRRADGFGAVLMDAPKERGEDMRPFLAVTDHLRDLGFSAPEIYATDPDTGFALIEDLGDALYARVCAAEPALEAPLYEAAVDLLAALKATPPPAIGAPERRMAVQPYDHAVLEREAMLALDWWTSAAAGREVSAEEKAEYSGLIADTCAHAEPLRETLVLRDYHAENLIWLPDREGCARVGLLDYQDALAGAAAYDLVSLLEDARRDTSDELQAAMLERFAAMTGAGADFRADYAALGAQRNLKIVGIFARLWLRDGKPAYLDLIPRVWAHVQRDLAHPACAALARFVAARIPPPGAAALARVRAART